METHAEPRKIASTDALFRPFSLGAVLLPHRIVMGPLTRSRAGQPGNVPTELNAEYYRQRASAALIISEATQISAEGQGYAWTPGIHTDAQVAGWKAVVDAVHREGGQIALQLWHVGRVSHRDLQPEGGLPVAPSAIKPEGKAFVAGPDGKGAFVPFETPRALETAEIARVVDDFAAAAQNAKRAGFDMVEIHGANGYLIDQFISSKTNHRNDRYGGPVENRARFLFEVIEAVAGVWPRDRIGLRLSPLGTFNDIADDTPEKTFGHIFEALNATQVAYLHLPRPDTAGGPDIDAMDPRSEHMLRLARETWRGPLMLAGGFSAEIAARWIEAGRMDVAVFGRKYIANPDLAHRFRYGLPLNEPKRETFYGGDARGYTDYPALAA
jgi:N-ethylmaleimide reductase